MMTTKVFTDRSRILSFQECPRRRYLAYHQDGLGITSVNKPLPLAVGGAVHAGLASLLESSMLFGDPLAVLSAIEQEAVAAALADLARYAGHLELDLAESTSQTLQDATGDQLAASLGMSPTDAGLGDLTARVGAARSEFDRFLAAEQSALVEALVRGYARRRLRPLLDQYEVLEVEREGEWKLGDVYLHSLEHMIRNPNEPPNELWFMSRPDALLLERATGQLSILSFKTAASWDVRKERDAQHDMQGLSEGVEVERRLAEWWQEMKSDQLNDSEINALIPSQRMQVYLLSCTAPPRIHAIRYEFLLKGDRRRDRDLSARLSLDARSQASHLVRAYRSPGMTSADEAWNWSWDYLKPGGTGETSKLYYKAWHATPVWEHMTIRAWIDLLDATHETVGEGGQALGWTGPAQATGATAQHPLDAVFLPPVVVYRNEDDLRDWMEQTEQQERTVAEGVRAVAAAGDEGERRQALNVHFPMYRRSCEYPSTCAFIRVCYGGEDIRRDPLGSGLYTIREVNHPQEAQR